MQGFSQIPGIDYSDTYAPVAKMASIRTFLALSAALDYEIHQIDIQNAYLNGEFMEDEAIYMKQPPEVRLTDNRSVFYAHSTDSGSPHATGTIVSGAYCAIVCRYSAVKLIKPSTSSGMVISRL